MVDVVVTIAGSGETGLRQARAIRQGGGLVGANSTIVERHALDLDFIDWPFLEADPSFETHIGLVERFEPTYAVAPDIEDAGQLSAVIDQADELGLYADHVIVIPKAVPVSAVPARFIVGAPFRNEWATDTGVNDYADFRGRPVHILGGNPTEQLHMADRYGLEVSSVDTPNPIVWAQNGRVWIARLGGANNVNALPEELWEVEAASTLGIPMKNDLMLTDEQLELIKSVNADESNSYVADRIQQAKYRATDRRLEFTVSNLVQAWESPGHRVTMTAAVEPGRGPPPPMDEPIETFPGEFLSVEEQLERFLEATVEEEVGHVRTQPGLVTYDEDDNE